MRILPRTARSRVSSRRRRTLLVAGVAAAVLTVGSGIAALGSDTGGPLDGDWALIQAEDRVGPFAVENAAISLIVRGESVSGYAACGDYQLRLTGDLARLKLEPRGSAAERAGSPERCPPQLEELRGLYLSALSASSQASLEGRTLRLRGEGVELVFIAMPAFPEAELVRTSWVLESYGEKWSGQKVTPRAGASTLRFHGSGRFAGTLACGRTVGFYRISGTEAQAISLEVVGPGTAAGSAFCPRAAAIQDLRLSELLRAFRATLAGDRLILSRNRLEVVFRPAEG